jgi:primosomal protein N' (replication factor Y)
MIVFVGQRGFAQNAYCTACHEIQTCPNCSVGLKFHKSTHTLKCHYCDFQRPFDEQCSSCSKKALTLLGFGIQGVEDELRAMHPTIKIARMDSDAMTSAQKLHDTLNDFAAKKINLLIGTQMVTKGHDFDGVGLVGVVGIDAHLGLPDFRAAEKSFQNLVQVAGRAGRSIKRGLVMVQTLSPRHTAIRKGIHHDFGSFAADELSTRKILNYPPFTRMIQFRFLSNSESVLKTFFEGWRPFLRQLRTHTTPQGIHVLGPTEMPLSKLRGKFRYHLCLKVPRGIKFQGLVHYILADLEKRRPKKIQWQVDVDPMGMM